MTSSLKVETNPIDVPNTLFGNVNKINLSEYNNTESQSVDKAKLNAFEKHPFKPYSSEKLHALADSIKENGLHAPILVGGLKRVYYFSHKLIKKELVNIAKRKCEIKLKVIKNKY